MDPRLQQSVLSTDVEHVEHERLLCVLRRALLAKPPQLDRAREIVAALDLDFPEHMRREELHVFPWVLERLPSARDEVDSLLREHLQLVTGITALRFAIRGEPPGGAIAAALRFVRSFRNHAARERNLTALALEQRASLRP